MFNLLIHKNAEISQFVDDATFILNGKCESMIVALNTLELLGSISGLKINTDKR